MQIKKETLIITVRVSKDLKQNILPRVSQYVNPGVLFESMIRSIHGHVEEMLETIPNSFLGKGKKSKSRDEKHAIVQLSDETITEFKTLQENLFEKLGKKPSFPTVLNLVLNSVDVDDIGDKILENVQECVDQQDNINP